MARKPNKPAPNSIAQNKKARFEYFIEETIEAGLALEGWEVKSLRAGKGQITETYVLFARWRGLVTWSAYNTVKYGIYPYHRRPGSHAQAIVEP